MATLAGLQPSWDLNSRDSHSPQPGHRDSRSSQGSDAVEVLSDRELGIELGPSRPAPAETSTKQSKPAYAKPSTDSTDSSPNSSNSSSTSSIPVWFESRSIGDFVESEPVVERKLSLGRSQPTSSSSTLKPSINHHHHHHHLGPEQSAMTVQTDLAAIDDQLAGSFKTSSVPLSPTPPRTSPKPAWSGPFPSIVRTRQPSPTPKTPERLFKPKHFFFGPISSKVRSSLGPAILSPIPGSPGPGSTLAPPPPPPLTRAHTSPPVLPLIETSEVVLTFSPPTASTLPTSPTWPSASPLPLPSSTAATWHDHALYRHPNMAASAPNLFSGLTVASPLLDGVSFDTPEMSPVLSPTRSASAVDLSSLSLNDLVDDSALRAGPSKLFFCLNELVETEAGYLDSLRVLVRVYTPTLSFVPCLRESEVNAIVRNGPSLLALHERIVSRLQAIEARTRWQSKGEQALLDPVVLRQAAAHVAQVFIDEMPEFDLYDDFCARHGEAIDIVRQIESRPEWEAFERQCGSRAATTPAAALSDSNFSPFFNQPLGSSTSTVQNSSGSTLTLPLDSPPVLTPTSAATATSSGSTPRSKLRFHDYAIGPIQRICRYPMMIGQVLKHMGDCDEHDKVEHALDGFKRIAERVDGSKRKREGELRTRLVASRMDFNSSANVALCDLLGQTLLVGTLHFFHKSSATPSSVEAVPRVKYYGILLFASHLVVVKVKKRETYEPREWLPLRLLDITALAEGEGLLPHSVRLTHGGHSFEMGATCAAERAIWLDALVETRDEACARWEIQPTDQDGKPTLSDDTLVSSIPVEASPTAPAPAPASSAPHRRTNSAASIVPASPLASSHPLPFSSDLGGRGQRLASSLIVHARTPAAQRAAIDLRLADVFSDDLVGARAAAAREASMALTGSTSRPARTRTTSAPKRAPQASVGRLTAKEKRRQSMADVTSLAHAEADAAAFRGAVGFDLNQEFMYRESPSSPKWTNSLRSRNKSAQSSQSQSHSHSPSARQRPQLPEIDIDAAVAASKAAGHSSWRSKTITPLRSATTPVAVDANPVPRCASPDAVSAAGDGVDRSNSVSSTLTNSSTGHSASSTGHTHLSSPATSVPPSPAGSTSRELDPAPRATDQAAKLARRRSTLGLPFSWASPPNRNAVEQLAPNPASPVEPTWAAAAARRRPTGGATIGNFFSKRVQSSPGLASFFSATAVGAGAGARAPTDGVSSVAVSPDGSPVSTPGSLASSGSGSGSRGTLSRATSSDSFGSALGLSMSGPPVGAGTGSGPGQGQGLARRSSTTPTRTKSIRSMFGLGLTPLPN